MSTTTGASGPDPGEALRWARIIANEDRIATAAAETIDLPEGRVIRQRACPHVFDANVVRHPRLDERDLDVALERLATPLRAIGARHVQIAGDAAPLGDGVRRGLRDRGFTLDRLLAMVLRGPPARSPLPEVAIGRIGSRLVDRAGHAAYAQAMDRMSRQEPWYSPRVSREIVASLSAKAAVGVLELHVAHLDRQAAGVAGLALDPSTKTAAITTVSTVPEARHRGVARSLVCALAERARGAGADLVYLIARADDTPKDMYRKFGFEVERAFEVWLRPPQPG